MCFPSPPFLVPVCPSSWLITLWIPGEEQELSSFSSRSFLCLFPSLRSHYSQHPVFTRQQAVLFSCSVEPNVTMCEIKDTHRNIKVSKMNGSKHPWKLICCYFLCEYKFDFLPLLPSIWTLSLFKGSIMYLYVKIFFLHFCDRTWTYIYSSVCLLFFCF